jgi:RimJ/RimL family protein N-acetyltransferase
MAGVNRPFSYRIELCGPTLFLRPLLSSDHDGLFVAAAHPEIWAGHPVKDRHTAAVFRPYFDFLVGAGGTLAIIDRTTSAIIGCSRYYQVAEWPHSIAIGFTFLNHRYWGGPTNLELKRLMLDHAFAHFDAVWFDIAPENIRSQMATKKLGARHSHDARMNLAGTDADWKCYVLDRKDWATHPAGRA